MFNYETLDIWRLAISYAKNIYRTTNQFPKCELYGLTDQLRRSAVSISANIAEGSGSSTTKDKINYIDISIKSALESTSEIRIALELNYISNDEYRKLYDEAEVLIKRIRSFKNFLKNHKLRV